jgi:CRP-like cAMP-binding protein
LKGDEGNSFFLLMSGEAYATKVLKPGEEPTKVMDYSKGSYFGELALIKNTPRAASVFAKVILIALIWTRQKSCA